MLSCIYICICESVFVFEFWVIQSNDSRYIVGRGFSNKEVASSIQIRLNIGQLRHDSLFEACRRPLIDGLKSVKLLDG